MKHTFGDDDRETIADMFRLLADDIENGAEVSAEIGYRVAPDEPLVAEVEAMIDVTELSADDLLYDT